MGDDTPVFGKGSRSHRKTKGERTERRLMDAAREVLAERGYQDTRIEDIAQAAGLAKGTLYIYFKNKRDITMEVMKEFVADGYSAMREARTHDDPFLEILEPTVEAMRLIFKHANLWKALLQFYHHEPEAVQMMKDYEAEYVARISRRMKLRLDGKAVDADSSSLVAHAMNWMVDGVLVGFLSYLSRENTRLEEVIDTPEQLGEILSVLWYRAVYCENPDPEHVKNARSVLGFRLKRDTR